MSEANCAAPSGSGRLNRTIKGRFAKWSKGTRVIVEGSGPTVTITRQTGKGGDLYNKMVEVPRDAIKFDSSNAKVRPYVEGEDLLGRMMCYRCRHSFPAPKGVGMAQYVKCPNCKAVDAYYQHKCHESDPNRHSAGWPYDDPTVECDC